jgi:anaerobic ribonucleoside-triphosphate reductase
MEVNLEYEQVSPPTKVQPARPYSVAAVPSAQTQMACKKAEEEVNRLRAKLAQQAQGVQERQQLYEGSSRELLQLQVRRGPHSCMTTETPTLC